MIKIVSLLEDIVYGYIARWMIVLFQQKGLRKQYRKEEKTFVVFRSADHRIIKKILGELQKKYSTAKILLIVQKECRKEYENSADIDLITVPDGRFSIDTFPSNKEFKKYYPIRRVYVPVKDIADPYDNIERIVRERLKTRTISYISYFGSEKKRVIRKRNAFTEMLERLFLIISLIVQEMIMGVYIKHNECS